MIKIYTRTKFLIFLGLSIYLSVNEIWSQSTVVFKDYMQLADNYKKNQEPDSAIIYYKKAALGFESLHDIEKLINANNQIAVVLTRQDKYEEAKSFLMQALSLGLSSLDSNNLLIANTYISLGVIYRAEEDYTQSLIYHYKALAIRLFKLGENSVEVATSFGNIGNVYLSIKDFEKSIEAHSMAMKIREKLFGEKSVEIIESYSGLGNAFRENRNFESSLEYFEKALNNKILQRGLGHKDLKKYYKNLSEVYYLKGDKLQGDAFSAKSEESLKP
ncbi:MAG: tetratricopeptide repeat protein [Saprospiraceae bacterium]